MKNFTKVNIYKLKKLLQNKGYKVYKRHKSYPKTIENFFYTDLYNLRNLCF